MKTLLIAAAAAVLGAPAIAAASDLSGTWRLAITAGDMTFNIDCTMTQQGAALSGSCTPVGVDGAQPSTFIGTVSGSTARWGYDVETGGAPMHLDYTANIRSDTAMAGAILQGSSAVTFTGAKSEVVSPGGSARTLP
jgi:hypothetical protein